MHQFGRCLWTAAAFVQVTGSGRFDFYPIFVQKYKSVSKQAAFSPTFHHHALVGRGEYTGVTIS
jgi:hypothetical protein